MKIYIFLFFTYSILYSAVTTRSIVSTRSAGLGKGIYGNIGLNDTVRDNPASIAFTKSYSIEAMYHSNLEKEINIIDLSIVDSKTSKIAGGFAYSKMIEKSGEMHDVFYVALAERYWNTVSFGLGGRYIRTSFEEEKLNFYDLDTGFLIAFNKYLGMGITWKNFLKRHEIFSPSELNLGFQGALSYFFPTFNITKIANNFNKFDNLIYSLGFEVVTKRNFSARLGYNFDNYENKRKYSLGAGWKGPKVSFDYAFLGNLKESNNYQHLVSMRVFF